MGEFYLAAGDLSKDHVMSRKERDLYLEKRGEHLLIHWEGDAQGSAVTGGTLHSQDSPEL